MDETSKSSPAAQVRERLRALEGFLESDPANPRLFEECAALAWQIEDYDAVLRASDVRLHGSPGDVLALSARTRALMAKREYRRAAEDLQRIHASHPQDSGVEQDLGLCYFCLGEFDRAKAPLESAYATQERTSGLIRLLVSTYHHLGLLDDAARVAAANPDPARDDAALSGAYALLYLDCERTADAARWARRALARDPDNVDALTVEGTLAAARGALDESTEFFQHALVQAPNTGRAWIGAGSVALLRQDFAAALESLRRGVELMPEHVGSWQVLGWTYLLSNDLDSAERVFQRTVELNHNYSEAHGSLAAVAALRGNTPVAQRCLEVARRLDPACLSVQFTEAVLIGRTGDSNQARRIILAALARLAPPPAMMRVAGLEKPSPKGH